MKLVALVLLFVGLLPALIQAHDYPIYPVEVSIKTESKRIRAEIKTNVIYWKEGILGKACTMPRNWPENMVETAKNYVDSHFQLFLDGKLMNGNMSDYRYVEIPFAGENGSNLFLILVIP